MPLFVIPFPDFDPVLISFGPLAIRWYALAYIAGILLGWLYARSLLHSEKLWGGPPDGLTTLTFRLVGDARNNLSGRIGYVLFYNLPCFVENPLESFQLWKGGMSSMAVSSVACSQWCYLHNRRISVLCLEVTRSRNDRHFLGRIANFIKGRGGAAHRRYLGTGSSGGPVARRKPALRSHAGGAATVHRPHVLIRRGALQRPGFYRFIRAYYGIARSICELFREPDAQQLSVGGLTMGILLSAADAGRLIFIAAALRRPPANSREGRRGCPARGRNPSPDRERRVLVCRYIWSLPHPSENGYYTGHAPIGNEGDFITAPEISQMSAAARVVDSDRLRAMGSPETCAS
jgi:phosphatidylglycerol:prolipoprotein diacylglycerol transferase